MRATTAAMLLGSIALIAAGCSSNRAQPAADSQTAPITAELRVTTPADLAAIHLGGDPTLLPPLPAGHTIAVNLVLLDKTIEIAPDVRYRAWTFNGSVPGPVIHARVGDTIQVTLSNRASIGHSIDFHAALAPPDVAFQTVQPGQTLRFTWVATSPGVFMYHCGTAPVLAHISNGMYGAVVIDPPGGWGDSARQYVLVQSEFYPRLVPGSADQFVGDMQKMKTGTPDVVTFNGVGYRYQVSPLPVTVGELVRLFVVNAGPSHFSGFHIVGSILRDVYVDGNPANHLVGIQTQDIPPGAGAIMEFKIDQAGKYPFLTHSFGDADAGAIGIFAAAPARP